MKSFSLFVSFRLIDNQYKAMKKMIYIDKN